MRLSRPLALLALILPLAGCWLPDDFTIDMNLRADGRYAFKYEGALTSFPMLRRLGEEDPAPEAERAWADIYIRDLQRDSGYERIEYLGLARFDVLYERQGDIVEHPTFYFVRSNSRIMAVTQVDAIVRLFGDRPPERYRQELIDKGFDVNGTVRIWTDAQVIDHNAARVVQGTPTRYEWEITSMNQPMPKMTLRIDRTETPET